MNYYVSKSYKDLDQIGMPYSEGDKLYLTVRGTNGNQKAIRLYTKSNSKVVPYDVKSEPTDDGVFSEINFSLDDGHNSHFIGEPKDKIELDIQCNAVLPISNKYGGAWRHIFHDECGNEYAWTTSSTKLEKGMWYIGTGVVKGHVLDNGHPLTNIYYCKLKTIDSVWESQT